MRTAMSEVRGYLLCSVIGLAVAASACGSAAPEPAEREDAEAPAEWTMPQALDERLRETDAALDDLEARIGQLSEDVQARLAPLLDNVTREREGLEATIAQMADRASDSWQEAERQLADGLSRLQRQATRLRLDTIEDQRAFTEAAEREINDLEEQIETAGQRLDDAAASSEDVIAAMREDLREQQVQLIALWREVNEASGEQWRDLKADLLDAWMAAQAQADELRARLDAAIDDTMSED